MTASELKSARKKLGLTQLEMAEALNTPLRTYHGWERGETKIRGPVEKAVLWIALERKAADEKKIK